MFTDLCKQIKNENEALAVLSALGFLNQDWSCIRRMGGAQRFFCSDPIMDLLRTKAKTFPRLVDGLKKARLCFDEFYNSGGFFITKGSKHSSRLFKYPQGPLAFYARFNNKIMDSLTAVSIVGSRKASFKALSFTQNLSSNLAKNGIVVVSGGAAGVDEAAHAGALSVSGATIMVSGSVLCLKGESVKSPLSKADPSKKLIIYPYGPFAPQAPFMFVERNKFVASLAKALVVVQGTEGSGTLHTASFAQSLGVPVFAVPGNIDDPLSYAPNQLLSLGKAKAIVDIDQLIDHLSSSGKKNECDGEVKKIEKAKGRNNDLPLVIKVMMSHGKSLYFDQLLELSKLPVGELQRQLLNQELLGTIIRCGSQFVLTCD